MINLTQKMQNQILKLSQIAKPWRTTVLQNTSEKKLNNACKAYLQDFAFGVNSEQIIVLHDSTFFGSAKRGFILTTRGLYYREPIFGSETKFIPLNDIKDFVVRSDFYVVTESGSFLLCITTGERDLSVYRYIQAFMLHILSILGMNMKAQLAEFYAVYQVDFKAADYME